MRGVIEVCRGRKLESPCVTLGIDMQDGIRKISISFGIGSSTRAATEYGRLIPGERRLRTLFNADEFGISPFRLRLPATQEASVPEVMPRIASPTFPGNFQSELLYYLSGMKPTLERNTNHKGNAMNPPIDLINEKMPPQEKRLADRLGDAVCVSSRSCLPGSRGRNK